MAKLFRDLQRAWERDGAGPDARAVLARWAEAQPALASYTSPAALVAAAHHRGADDAKALVEALTEKAPTDAWAARTVLHGLLPGLAAMSREHLDMVGPAREPFGDVDDLDHFVVSKAYERIAEVASEVPRYRLRKVLDSTWSQLRTHAKAHRREHDRRVDINDLPGGQPGPARSAAEELALILVDSVERRVCRRCRNSLARRCRYFPPGSWNQGSTRWRLLSAEPGREDLRAEWRGRWRRAIQGCRR
ncbi:MAG: hypothetical protein LC799_26680 [Actinobacteria bacterium]|nr:hypothetical protein [Actinomycetota bacterium]